MENNHSGPEVVKNSQSRINHLPCNAMREAGVEDAASKEGVRFCMESCPYDDCGLEGCFVRSAKVETKR